MDAADGPRRSASRRRSSIAIQLQQNDQLRGRERRLPADPRGRARPSRRAALRRRARAPAGAQRRGVALIEKSLALAPDRADWHSNLGIVLQAIGAAGRGDRRVPAGDRARSGRMPMRTTTSACCCRAQGKPVEAEAAYRTAIALDPEHIDAYTNLGILLNGQKRTQEAVACFCKVDHAAARSTREARRLLALAHCTLGELDKAVEIFEDGSRRSRTTRSRGTCWPPAPGATCRRAPRTRYVETDVRQLRRAASMPSSRKLSYRAPALVAAMLADVGPRAGEDASTCSTPAAAPACAARCSRRMRARLVGRRSVGAACWRRREERNVYDELVKAELTAYLRDCPGAFDVIVSADTLVYFGALDEVVAAAAARAAARRTARSSRWRSCDGESDAASTRLSPHGRYSHARGVRRARARPTRVCGRRSSPAELRLEAGDAGRGAGGAGDEA